MAKPKISVIIPCYNVEKYIEQAVNSVLEQDYDEIEIILVDDGSTDGTAHICDSYAERYENVTVIHQKNSGQACARNIGLDHSTGEYVYFLDSDDWIKQGMFTAIFSKADANSVDMIFFDAYTVDERGVQLENAPAYVKTELKEGIKSGKEWYQTMLKLCNFAACVPYHVYKKAFLIDNYLKFYPGIIHEDELFLFYAYLKAKTVRRDIGVYYYRRIRPGSTMTSENYIYMFDSMQTIMGVVLEQDRKNGFTKDEMDTLKLFLERIRDIMVGRYFQIELGKRKPREKKLVQVLKTYRKFMWKQRDIKGIGWILKARYRVFRMNGARAE